MKAKTQIAIIVSTTAAIIVALAIALLVRYRLSKRVSETTIQQFGNPSLPRGYRNNNPLNIRISSDRWLGKVEPNTDGAFEQFAQPVYGYRAAIKLIQNYIRNRHLTTISQIVSRWAPPSENYTQNYIQHVADTTGIPADATLSPSNKQQITSIVYAMAIRENGPKPMPDMATINEAWDML